MIIYHKKKNNNENKQTKQQEQPTILLTTGTRREKKKKERSWLCFLLLDWVVVGWIVVADTKDFIIQQSKQSNKQIKRRITEMGRAINVVLCCVGGKIFVVYSAITIIVNGTTKPPSWHQNPHRSSSVHPSLPPPHTLQSFILYLYELSLSTTNNSTNKSCKIFRKDGDFNEEDNFSHDEEEDDDEGNDIIHKD
jgi:hypothetical protein